LSTIAYRDGVLAGDSLVTTQTTVIGQKQKVFDVIAGENDEKRYLVGVVGCISDIEAFVRWVRDDFSPHSHPRRELGDGEDLAEAIVVNPQTSRIGLFAGPDFEAEYIDAPYYALGSGAKFALGAMHAGAGAELAVEAAKEHDLRTGGSIRVVQLEKEKL